MKTMKKEYVLVLSAHLGDPRKPHGEIRVVQKTYPRRKGYTVVAINRVR